MDHTMAGDTHRTPARTSWHRDNELVGEALR